MSVLIARENSFSPSEKLDLPVQPFSLNKYDACAFNGLLHGHVASKIFMEDAVDRLGALVIAHGLEESVGIWRAHKHFDIAEGEQVVGRLTHDSLIDVTVEPELSDADLDAVLPTHFKFEIDGTATPVQFMESGGSLGQVLSMNMANTFLANPTFLPEFAALVTALGVNDRLGLSLRWDLALKDAAPDGTFENTEEHERTQTVVPLVLEDELWSGNTTMWTFEKQGGVGIGPGLGGAVVKKHKCQCGHTKRHCDD